MEASSNSDADGAASPAAKAGKAISRAINNACDAAGREYDTNVVGTTAAVVFAVSAAIVVPAIVVGIGTWAIVNILCGKRNS